ncbi:SGNH/GDSL hydrolase family protein [Sphingobacterium siyangense]|uniref:SGNH/GDSL hydrolase family protein n=1 Tax=Sphingobacterium siyangense TaxID=459529 RepID=UPI003C76C02D
MNFLKKQSLKQLTISLINASIILFSFNSCKKDKQEIRDILRPVNPEYIKFNEKSISIFRLNEKEKLEYPISFNLEKYELLVSFKPVQTYVEGFFGKGMGGVKFEGKKLSFYNNKGDLLSTKEWNVEEGVEIKIKKDIESIKYFFDDILMESFEIKDQSTAVLLRGAPILYFEKGAAEIIYFSINSYKNPSVFVIGDSIVEGGAFVSYKSDITKKWSNLINPKFPIDNIAIDGYGGSKMDLETSNRIIKEIDIFKPKLVFVCFGTNNTSNPGEYIDNANKILEYCKAKGLKIVLSTSLPRPNYAFSNSGAAINDWVRGSKIDVLDYYNYLYENGYIISNRFFDDSFHPNVNGNKIIAEHAVEIINKNML